METYIVRIYRNSGTQLAGMLETVECGWQRPFLELTELMTILEQVTGHGGVSDTSDRADSSMHQVAVPRHVSP